MTGQPCRYCREPIRRGDTVAPWVHVATGNSFCDVTGPADAVAHAATMPPQERYEAGPEGYVLDCGHVAEVDGPCGPTTGRAWCVECGESAVVVERT